MNFKIFLRIKRNFKKFIEKWSSELSKVNVRKEIVNDLYLYHLLFTNYIIDQMS